VVEKPALNLLSVTESLFCCAMCQFASEGRAVPGPDGIISANSLQISFVGATMPRDLENILGDVVPVIEFLML